MKPFDYFVAGIVFCLALSLMIIIKDVYRERHPRIDVKATTSPCIPIRNDLQANNLYPHAN